LNIVAFMLDSIRLFRLHLSLNMIEVLLFYLLALLFIWKDNKLFLLIGLLIIFVDILIPYLDSNAYVYFLDVNQGDSCLVISANRKDVIMIDTGGMDNYSVSDNVISFLYSLGIDKIDLLILSHGDKDHAGEITNLLKNIDIEHLKLNKGELSEYELIARNNISLSPYETKNMYLTYLNYKEYDNENDNSVLTYIKINGVNILSMGDASYTVENDLINKYKINVDILKVSHHGSKTSSDSYFINSINPKYSVISVGKNNKYGHPNKEVLENLKNTEIYRTDLDGSIMFKIKNGKIKTDICNP
ncbi:MAG: MBL fold metallo-hydrolase, partial [Bacilli bacterium]|nr:MBL fold metallo-hydrolase [Bacilli bacterium]